MFSSVAQSCSTLCDLMDCSFPLHHQLPRLLKLMSIESVMPSNHLILVVPFSSCLQSFPASGSFPTSQFFTSGIQSIGASASASVFPVNIQDWFPLGWTGLISLQSKELSRVFSNTTVQNHQFFSAQFSLWSNCHIHTWLREHSYIELNNYYRDSCTLLLTKRGIQKRTANIDDQRTKDQNTDSNLSEFL